MKFLSEPYRDFEFKISIPNRLIFNAETPPVAKSAPPVNSHDTKNSANIKDFSYHQARFDAHMGKLPHSIAQKTKDVFNAQFKKLKAKYDKLVKDKKSKQLKDSILGFNRNLKALLKKIQAHHPKTAVSKPKASVEKNRNNLNILTNQIAKLMGVTKEVDKLYIKTFIIPQIKISPNQKNQLALGALELTPTQKTELAKLKPPYLKKADSGFEFKTLRDFTAKHNGLAKFFDHFTDPAFQLLSQKYDFKLEKGKLKIMQGGKEVDGSPAIKPVDLLKFFTSDLKTQFEAIIKNKKHKKEKTSKLVKKLAKKVSDNNVFIKFKETFFPNGKMPKTGLIAQIMMFVALYKKAMSSLQKGDVSELKDYLDAWRQAGNPTKLAEIIGKAKGHYEKALKNRNPKPGLRLLLKAYLNPSKKGKSANKLFTFTEKGIANLPKLMQFRSHAKKPIRDYIIKHMKSHGITNVVAINRMPSGAISITAYYKNKKVAIDVSSSGSLKAVPMRSYVVIKKKEKRGSVIKSLDLDKFGHKKSG